MTDLIVTRWGARFGQRFMPCAIGRGGIGVKGGEGDGITPIGTYRLMQVHYRGDRVAPPCPAVDNLVIGPRDVWSDDPRDSAYNHVVFNRAHPFSHENLRRADPLYDAFGVLDFNWPEATAGAGSAIFLHIWRKPRHPTEGCVAFARSDFWWLLRNWTSNSRVIIRRG